MKTKRWVLAAASWVAMAGAAAQSDPTVFAEQEKLVRAGEAVSAYGPELLGDRVNLYSGKLEFSHTDV
jgi:hypothetical protein